MPYIVFEVLACAGNCCVSKTVLDYKKVAYKHTPQTVGGGGGGGCSMWKAKMDKIGSAHQICCTSLAPPLPIPYGTRVKFMTYIQFMDIISD